MKDLKKCHICGVTEEEAELTKCDTCNETVCADSESCSEKLGLHEEFTMCKSCLDKSEKCDCHKCKNRYTDDCPMLEYDYVYDCPEYNPEGEE